MMSWQEKMQWVSLIEYFVVAAGGQVMYLIVIHPKDLSFASLEVGWGLVVVVVVSVLAVAVAAAAAAS